MRFLRYLLLAVIAIVLVILVVALFVPKTFKYEKSIGISAPIDSVWKNTNSLAALDKWSPWNDHDPNMKKEMTGEDGSVGAKQSWESAIIGSGSQTIETVQKPILLETKLDFLKPRESHGKAYVKLVTDGAGTKATWGMAGSMPYPFNVMILFMNMEKTMGKDWDRGFARLKSLSEKK